MHRASPFVHLSYEVMIWFIVLLSSNYVSCQQQNAKVIKIAAIFEGQTPELESVFRRTIDRINMDKTRLPGSRLEGLVASINDRDSFHAAKIGMFCCWLCFARVARN